MNPEINKLKLASLLRGPLPGQSAQWRMAPESRVSDANFKTCRHAAVLLLIYPENSELCLLFIKRNEYDGPHSGQISFPGGMVEPEDKDPYYTALRETEEETGVLSKDIEIVGSLTPLYIPVSNFQVQPVVGWINYNPTFIPDKSEVQYIITPTLESLIDTKNRNVESIQIQEKRIKVPFYSAGTEKIWGATAMILSEFIELLGY